MSSVGQKPSSDNVLKKQHGSSDKHEASKNMDSSSSSDDDNDIPLFQRIKKKRKIDKRNGSLFGSNIGELSSSGRGSANSEMTKNHIGSSSRNHIEPPTFLPKHGSNKIKNGSGSKGIKLISEPFARKELNQKTSNMKETVVRKHPTTKVQSSSKRKSNLPTRFCRDNESQGTADVNSAISKQSGLERLKKSQSSSHSTNSQSSALVSNTQKSCMLQSKVYESDPGPASSKGSKVKNKRKSPPGNTVCDSKNNVIQRRIKDLFGSDTESEGDILETEEQVRARNSKQISPNRSSSGNDVSIKKKNKSTSRKTACNSDKDSQSKRHSSCHNKLQGHLNERGEAFVRDFRQSTSAGSDSNRGKKTKKSKPCPIVSDDSTDTEPEVSLLTARPAVVRNKCNSQEQTAKHVGETRNESSHSDDSDVEMMSAKESPEKSPVFNRAVTPPLRRRYEERRGGDRQSSNSNLAGSRVSRTSKVNNRRRIAEEHASSDSDVVPVDDEVELVSPHGLSRRHGHEVVLGRNSIHFGAELSRRVGGSSELGSPIDLGSIMRVSSSDLSRPGPSFHQERRRRKRPSRGAGNHERTSRGAGSSSTAETQQRQLEADEQLARDLASGKISTPISGRKMKRKGSKSSSRRNRQMAEDEALARELASGNIRTPVDQQRPSQQIDDDEALARQLQEQFNAEAMEEPQEDDTDTSSNRCLLIFLVSIRLPSTMRWEFRVSKAIPDFQSCNGAGSNGRASRFPT
ncbi:uncharacterized protein [Amphiura filiformis]|uniref:uncharacterized protein n=1 Tax=Amphiura filiformis TaxID=82378 RepID=UPI003B211FCF